MRMKDLLTSYYTTPDVLKITGLKAETLQTWMNRRVIKLATQNPGRGKPRLYSSIDVMKLAILRRTDDLDIALTVALEVVEGAANMLLEEGAIDWNLYISHSPKKNPEFTISSMPRRAGLEKYFPNFSPKVLDPTETHLSEFVEPRSVAERRDRRGGIELDNAEKALALYESIGVNRALAQSTGRVAAHISDEEKRRFSEERQILSEATVRRPMNIKRREMLARMGIHNEPVIVFPIGEISNGALAQLRGLDEERLND